MLMATTATKKTSPSTFREKMARILMIFLYKYRHQQLLAIQRNLLPRHRPPVMESGPGKNPGNPMTKRAKTRKKRPSSFWGQRPFSSIELFREKTTSKTRTRSSQTLRLCEKISLQCCLCLLVQLMHAKNISRSGDGHFQPM